MLKATSDLNILSRAFGSRKPPRKVTNVTFHVASFSGSLHEISAAVDQDRLAIDVSSVFGEQERHEAGCDLGKNIAAISTAKPSGTPGV